MSTFVLVHGGYHGGWCWERVVRGLTERGHRAIAPDLPCDDAAAGYEEYVASVLRAMGPLGDDPDVVLVGHSLGCYTVPLVATQRPVRWLVLLCAVPALGGEPIPYDEGSILTEDMRTYPRFVDPDGRTMAAPADFERIFYQDLPPDEAARALRRLRPQGSRPITEPWPLRAWPVVPRTIVLTEDDNVVDVERGRAAAEALTGEPPVVLPGSHSVMLSQAEALVDLLVGGPRV